MIKTDVNMDMEARERELAVRELKVMAREKLQERGLSQELLGILSFEDEEKCVKSLDAVESVFRSEVKRLVDAALSKGRVTLPGGSARNEDAETDSEYYSRIFGKD